MQISRINSIQNTKVHKRNLKSFCANKMINEQKDNFESEKKKKISAKDVLLIVGAIPLILIVTRCIKTLKSQK